MTVKNSKTGALTPVEARALAELDGVRKAAAAAAKRMRALEDQAEEIHQQTLLNCTARILSTPQGGISAIISDSHGATIELSNGAVAISIRK